MAEGRDFSALMDVWENPDISVGGKIWGSFLWLLLQKFFWAAVILFFILKSCGSGGDKISSIEDLRGTTWQSNDNVGATVWFKLTLNKDDTYDAWASVPSVGYWDNHHSGKYSVSEGRSSENGKKFFCVTLQNPQTLLRNLCVYADESDPEAQFTDFCDMKGVWSGRNVYAKQTDENPW
jgi:hypothetical protein